MASSHLSIAVQLVTFINQGCKYYLSVHGPLSPFERFLKSEIASKSDYENIDDFISVI